MVLVPLEKETSQEEFSALLESSPQRTGPVYSFFPIEEKKERSVCISAEGSRLALENHFPMVSVLKWRNGLSGEICNLHSCRPLKKSIYVNY